MPSTLKTHLFAEPRGGRIYWLHLVLGLVIVALGTAWFVVDAALLPSPVFIPLGVAIACLGAAEQLPRDRTRVAAILRTGYYTGLVLYAGLFLLPPVLAGGQTSAYWAFLVALVAGAVITLWAAWQFWTTDRAAR